MLRPIFAIALAVIVSGAALLPARATTLSSRLFQLDSSFGVGGKRTVDVGGPSWEDEPFDIVQQPDGKYIIAGKAMNQKTGNFDWTIIRFNADGSLDPTFGWGGVVLTDFYGGHDEAIALALQPDGKVVVAGFAGNPGPEAYPGCEENCISVPTDFAVVRYNPNGSRDYGFGWYGYVTIDFFGGQDMASAIAIQPDGKILVGGEAFRTSADADFAIARLNPNGSRDASFGWGGLVATSFSKGADAAYKLVLQPDGKIIAVGAAWSATTNNYDFALARYNTNGSLDPTFGWGGLVMTDFFGQTDVAFATAMQPDGKLVVGGLAQNPNTNSFDFAIARYNTNGSLDPAFASYGKPGVGTVDFAGGYDQIRWLMIQPDGKIVAVGHTVSPTTGFDFGVARFNTDGTLDPSFADGGKFSMDWYGENDGIHSGLLQPDGKLTVAGDIRNPNTNGDDFAVARYLVADPSWIEGAVSGLPSADFLAGTQPTIIAGLQQIDADIAANDAPGALSALATLRTHLDGCGSAPDAGDWVTNCGAQTQIRGLIDQVAAKLAS
jgi:uncharacterized delta-60 repeat protein